jgi:two-component system, chemotaxis family, protein-glutamate methylesterase/glutaminase
MRKGLPASAAPLNWPEYCEAPVDPLWNSAPVGDAHGCEARHSEAYVAEEAAVGESLSHERRVQRRARVARRDMIVIGASNGGVEALSLLMGALPDDLPAAVFVVQHLSPQSPSYLPEILSRRGPLPANHPDDGEPFQPGRVYLAPPDRHMLIEVSRTRLGRGPKENLSRPAADALFRSAALTHGPRVIGVVLTGALDDGTAGLWAVKRYGGIAVVQDPSEAQHASMPESALEYVDVDHCLPVAEIGRLLARLTREEAPAADPELVVARASQAADYLALMLGRAKGEAQGATMGEKQIPLENGALAGYVCPECNGPLWEIHEGRLVRFRCRVGHGFSRDSLLVGQSGAVDQTLWTAYETLCENALLAERYARKAREWGRSDVIVRLEERARRQWRRAERLRRIIEVGDGPEPVDDAAGQEHS